MTPNNISAPGAAPRYNSPGILSRCPGIITNGLESKHSCVTSCVGLVNGHILNSYRPPKWWAVNLYLNSTISPDVYVLDTGHCLEADVMCGWAAENSSPLF